MGHFVTSKAANMLMTPNFDIMYDKCNGFCLCCTWTNRICHKDGKCIKPDLRVLVAMKGGDGGGVDVEGKPVLSTRKFQ